MVRIIKREVKKIAQINFTIPNEKLQRIVDAMKGLYPIPTTYNEETKEFENDFTENQWAKESVRRWIIKQVQRYESSEAQKTAKQSITLDDSIIT